ncbi:hypothetical protein [Sporolactobacillus terrae]|uniref:Uncharacterized protein n=1 Tax=Sporolactobacillus terrae TaxID=269673 RepID=A0A5K7WTP6_9BACL|nr:hypothetical protein [Sporolactobacillus terrae]BBN97717.1 hypothetical protein St703_04220 [Sporolactobacillus terrae]
MSYKEDEKAMIEAVDRHFQEMIEKSGYPYEDVHKESTCAKRPWQWIHRLLVKL